MRGGVTLGSSPGPGAGVGAGSYLRRRISGNSSHHRSIPSSSHNNLSEMVRSPSGSLGFTPNVKVRTARTSSLRWTEARGAGLGREF